MIGNGWISPVDQYMAYSNYAYRHGLLSSGTSEAKAVDNQVAICIKMLDEGAKDQISTPACEEVLQTILRLTQVQNRCYNMYDVRLRDSFPSCGLRWPLDLEYVTPYLRQTDVVEALHVGPDKKTGWTECSGAVGSHFEARNSRPSVELMPKLLAEVPVLLFSGEQDLICNHLGTEEMIHRLAWNGGVGFEVSPGTWAPRREWTFEGEAAGMYQSARNLTYVLYYNSSHMVPYDYPRRTRDMLDRFMGVDIASIGGVPADSRIDGEKGLETSVGGHPNSTVAEREQQDRMHSAARKAYFKSSEIAFAIVVLVVGLWAYYYYFVRKRRAKQASRLGLRHANGSVSTEGFLASRLAGLQPFRHGRLDNGDDIEAADFDETQLEDMGKKGRSPGERRSSDARRYSIGGTSSDEGEQQPPPQQQHQEYSDDDTRRNLIKGAER